MATKNSTNIVPVALFLLKGVSLWCCICITLQTEIHIDLQSVIHSTDEKFIGVTIDSGILREHWGNFNPESHKLQTLASALAPCYLRVGGNDADFLIFNEEDSMSSSIHAGHSGSNSGQDLSALDDRLKWDKVVQNSEKQGDDVRRAKWNTKEGMNLKVSYSQSKQKHTFHEDRITNFTMSAKMYDQLHQFVAKVGWLLIFDLNVLIRKEGGWDPANAIQLMDYTVKKGYHMAGWELGNEPDSLDVLVKNCTISPEKLSADYAVLLKTLQGFSQYSNTLILGPSVAQLSVDWRIMYFWSFLNSGGAKIVTAATFHQYYIEGATATIEQFTDPSQLNVLLKEVAYGVNITRDSGSKAAVWLGETSSAWGGGAPGLSNRYVAAFMWLDKLGISAAGGVDVVIRQSFYGYNYSLVDNLTYEPLPDYWLTLLFKLLVGNRVLKVISPSNTGHLRAYAHCTATNKSGYQRGSVVVYVLNLASEDQTLTFPDLTDTPRLHVYSIGPQGGNLTAKTVLLNGQPLQMINNSTLPSLLRPVITQAPVNIRSLTYSFIVFPDARVKACL